MNKVSVLYVSGLSNINELSSNNFECGFYPIVNSFIVYRLSYLMFIVLFLLYELELIIVLFMIFGYHSFIIYGGILLLLFILLFDLFVLYLVSGLLFKLLIEICVWWYL